MAEDVNKAVQEKYGRLITAKLERNGELDCCANLGGNGGKQVSAGLYQAEEVNELPENMISLSLGCGNPTALTPLYAGEVVLDLGSGAGLDVLLSARRVGKTGKAYGLDMTDEMLAVARSNQQKAGIKNAEFLKGQIEQIPLEANRIDVIISNCVINLSGNKERVMEEMFRVVRSGGRIAISDIVLKKELPLELQNEALSMLGCISGALLEQEYKEKLEAAGFKDVEIATVREYEFDQFTGAERAELTGSVVSAFIRAKKPADFLVCGNDYEIRQARQGDLAAIQELLQTNKLPIVAVEQYLKQFLVAEHDGVLGAIGVHIHETKALIRSFVVSRKARKQKIGQSLVDSMLKKLKERGITETYLLTETASSYFRRLGFHEVSRDQIPISLLEESGLDQACPCSSSSMSRLL